MALTTFHSYESGDVISSDDLNAVRGAVNALEDRLSALMGVLAQGGIMYVDGSGDLVILPIGSEGQILKVVSGIPAWVNP